MLKKSLYVAAAAVLLLGLLFGRDAASYVSTSVAHIRQQVKDSVPVEFDIERARNMIKDIDPEIRESTRVIAKETVEVEHLAGQIRDLEAKLAADEETIMKMKGDLESGESYIYYTGKRYSQDEVKGDLANKFARFKTTDETLANLRKVMHARQTGLDAASEQLNGMIAAKRQLEVEVENLEARQKMVEVAKTTADFNFDDSHLSRTKELISEIQTRLQVEETMLNTYGDYEEKGEIQVNAAPEAKNVTDEITEYFGGARPSNVLVGAEK